jgi:hypothetical protein
MYYFLALLFSPLNSAGHRCGKGNCSCQCKDCCASKTYEELPESSPIVDNSSSTIAGEGLAMELTDAEKGKHINLPNKIK